VLNSQNNVEISKTNNRSLNRPADNHLRVRSFVCKGPNEITTNVSQIAGWPFTEPRGWRVSGHQRYLVTLRYSRNRIDAYDYVDASCFTSERMVEAHPALYRVYGFISCGQLRTGIPSTNGLDAICMNITRRVAHHFCPITHLSSI